MKANHPTGIDPRLSQVLQGQEDNYLLPFYWQHGNHYDRIPAQIQRIRDSGCRAICLESRPHPDFCGPGWWRDVDLILEECRKRDMQVWILDDKHFPTGYVNGQMPTKYPHLRPWNLVERHVDVIGPLSHASLLMTPGSEEEPLVGVFAYRRSGEDENLTGSPVDLTDGVRNGFLYLDIPEGCWRVFFLYRSHRGGHQDYIDMIAEGAGAALLETVYQPHYNRYAAYFGNTLAGFFSDEPQFGNGYVGQRRVDKGLYEMRIGQDGLALPYSDRLLAMMTEELGEDATPYLGELWYISEHAPLTRLAYMNAVTRLYRDNFCRPVGDWCRAHGVAYIGHVIEDMNAHTRLGYGTGHYFRALEGQDMGGIDIVLHQVMPGMAHYMSSASCATGLSDSEFFHYVLGQLAASLAHQQPHMAGRAMCEVFGAYGWGEGTPMMKWLMDFLLVRGVNYFVPHAFSPDYPDPDCPPHFGAEGHDPQFEGFTALMNYTNKAAHLLSGGDHVAPVALLYHAEGEWMNPRDTAMLTQKPARVLYDRQINYDIVCADILMGAEVSDGRLTVGRERFRALVVPYARLLPADLISRLNQMTAAGLPVLYVDGLPEGAEGQAVPLCDLADTVIARGLTDFTLEGDSPLLRVYHTVRDGHHVFMLFNESASDTARGVMHLPEGVEGSFTRLRLLEDAVWRDETGGCAALELAPGQSEIWVFGDTPELPRRPVLSVARELNPTYTVELAESDDLTDERDPAAYRPYTVTDTLFDVGGPEAIPGFAGKMRYTFRLPLAKVPAGATLDLGQVGANASVTVNGQDVGIRIAPPYTYPVEACLVPGENTVTVTVSNTLAGKLRDHFSFYLTLGPSGLMGPVRLLSEAEA